MFVWLHLIDQQFKNKFAEKREYPKANRCQSQRSASVRNLILRRSRSLAATHSLPSPSDGLGSSPCSRRHRLFVNFTQSELTLHFLRSEECGCAGLDETAFFGVEVNITKAFNIPKV